MSSETRNVRFDVSSLGVPRGRRCCVGKGGSLPRLEGILCKNNGVPPSDAGGLGGEIDTGIELVTGGADRCTDDLSVKREPEETWAGGGGSGPVGADFG